MIVVQIEKWKTSVGIMLPGGSSFAVYYNVTLCIFVFFRWMKHIFHRPSLAHFNPQPHPPTTTTQTLCGVRYVSNMSIGIIYNRSLGLSIDDSGVIQTLSILFELVNTMIMSMERTSLNTAVYCYGSA